jgi:hypothetical protein
MGRPELIAQKLMPTESLEQAMLKLAFLSLSTPRC